jgi:electron transfer flavoprotein beta subunit
MANMRAIMPALQKAKPATLAPNAIRYLSAAPPKQQRQTRIVKNESPEKIAAELLEWIDQ